MFWKKTAGLVQEDWYESVSRSGRRAAALGYTFIGLFVLGFGSWAGTALIAGAIVTPGYFVATGENKIVQHLEGGVIKDILVHEGDRVERGQPLVVLDDTQPKAELRRLHLREARLEAMRIRLQAEAKQERNLAWPDDFQKYRDDAEVQTILDAQMSTFVARRRNIDTDVATLQESINALEARIEASKMQMSNVERQSALYNEEIGTKKVLVSSGLSRKSELLALQRGEAASSGEIARLMGDVGDARDRIARAREQINGVHSAAVKQAMEQLQEALADLQDTRERIRTAKLTLERIEIRAPVRGVVVKMRYHTAGGVVEPGRSIMEILPVDDSLLIEARVQPKDIEHVKVGQDAVVRITGLSARSTPTLTGTVVYVSADAVPDKAGFNASLDGSSRDVYLARVKIDSREMERIPGFHPIAGMPVELFVRTGERTFFEYLTKPVMDSFTRAFREI
ncbi:HlyD family type I secretion periplasmic adaptor subunit [Reyranella sp.]|jgi:HlyD family secretion protein|uniref:HlyD family type I secretion periplasmic adaptor subunit n=1 Tax=Reyranella sp. TaxID=1929291 RepID=UPI002F95ED7E